MKYVIRANFSDESIALIEHLSQLGVQGSVVYIDTGWAAKGWADRVELAQKWVMSKGFEFIALKSQMTLQELVRERRGFPNRKFQWCAGLLKGIPLLQWLDEQDPACESIVCIAKRQALMRQPLTEFIEECEYHGDRRVWHPLHQASEEAVSILLAQSQFPLHGFGRRSLECDPCVNASVFDLTLMQIEDIQKTETLEKELKQPFFGAGRFGTSENIIDAVAWSSSRRAEGEATQALDQFSLGCGDPFGCGL